MSIFQSASLFDHFWLNAIFVALTYFIGYLGGGSVETLVRSVRNERFDASWLSLRHFFGLACLIIGTYIIGITVRTNPGSTTVCIIGSVAAFLGILKGRKVASRSRRMGRLLTSSKQLTDDFPYRDGPRLAWSIRCPIEGTKQVIYTRADLVCEGFDYNCSAACGSHIDVTIKGNSVTVSTYSTEA